jgi:cytochrome c
MKRYLASGAVFALILSGCGSVDATLVTRPAGSTAFQGDRAELVVAGEALWNDDSLGEAGVSCSSCHVGGAQFKDTFKEPYPHRVAMADNMSGLASIDAEQMVQFCMIVPMKGEPLAWDSRELAALAAYIDDVEQPNFANK